VGNFTVKVCPSTLIILTEKIGGNHIIGPRDLIVRAGHMVDVLGVSGTDYINTRGSLVM